MEEGAKLEDVTAEIKADPYFAHDETHVFAVASVDDESSGFTLPVFNAANTETVLIKAELCLLAAKESTLS